MRVLLADDDGIARLLVSRQLMALGYEVLQFADADEAWSVLKKTDGVNVVLIDWAIRGLSASALCQRARAYDGVRSAYIIALVSSQDHEREVALEDGCDDFLLKPVDLVELRLRMRNAARVADMKRRLLEAESQACEEASHDRLTGLWNRAAILQFLAGQFARSSRDGVSMAVALVNLDRFAEYNESNGRDAGDALLRHVATRMRNAVRPYDWLGRTEGDSFLIIAPDCTLSNGFAMCERLRAMIAEVTTQFSGSSSGVTASFGLATSAESGVTNEDALLRSAESALFQAKQNGRNRVESARRVSRPRNLPVRSAASRHRELLQ